MKINCEEYESIIIYGIGQYYELIKKDLFQRVTPDYLCDRKWDDYAPSNYDGIPIIKREELCLLKQSLIITTTRVPFLDASIRSDLKMEAFVISADDVIGKPKSITGKELKETFCKGYYQDLWGNCIRFDETIPDSIIISFLGKQNTLEIGRNVLADNLAIAFGNDGECSIGDGTLVVGGEFFVAGAKLIVGKHCLLAHGIVIRNHDSHHIFDEATHKRINYPKDIAIGDHVWIGQRSILLPGTRIGKGSVVGAGTITSNSFGEHLIIAGSPARVIREHVCWSAENTGYFNRDMLEECISQDALEYL